MQQSITGLNRGNSAAPPAASCAAGSPVVYSHPDNVIEDEIVLKPISIATPSAPCLFAALKAMLPQAIWDLLVGDMDIGNGMAVMHIGTDHHKACLKLAAWFIQNAPEWLLVFEDWCKQHASGLRISPLCHYWNIINPTYSID